MPRRKSRRQDSDDEYQNSTDEEDVDFKYIPVKTEIVERSDDESDGDTFDLMGEETQVRLPSSKSRPKRKAAVNAVEQIKDEPFDHGASDSGDGDGEGFEGDSDYLMNEDDDDEENKKKRRSRRGTCKRKSVSEMSEQEREKMKAKWREEARQRREKRRNEGKKGPYRRKKVSEMTEEEREAMKAKWREEARQRRAKRRAESTTATTVQRKKVSGIKDGDEQKIKGRDCTSGTSGGEESEKDKSLNRSQSQSRSQRRRKLVAEMSEEEREALKIKWREEARQRRARKREQMTEEERREEIKKQNEQRKLLRWKKLAAEGKTVRVKKEPWEKKKRKPLTEEEKEKKREWRRKWRANMTEEEKMRRREKLREQRAKMTPEERRMKYYMDRQARLARMTKEEREEEKERLRRKRLERRGGLEGQKEYQRKWRESMTNEQKDRFRRQLRESYYRKIERIRKDPELLQKWRDKNKENYQKKVMRSLETGIPFRKSRKGMRSARTGNSKYAVNKDLECLRRWRKIQDIKRRLEIQNMLKEGMSLEEIFKKIDPYGGNEEKRQRRLIRQRVNKRKLNLRRQLEGMGVDEEEIKKRLEEVEMTFQPTLQFRPFKLHSKSMEPVGPEELKFLEEEENKASMGRWRYKHGYPNESPPESEQSGAPPQQNRVPNQEQPKSIPQHQQSRTTSSQQPQGSLPYQQNSGIPHQPTYSLEHFLHGMNFNYSTAQQSTSQPGPSTKYPNSSTFNHNHHHFQNTSPPAPPQPTYQHYESSYSSSQHEYPQSNYTNSPPPASPVGGDDDNDNYEEDHYHNYHHHHQHQQPSSFLYSQPPQPPVEPPVREKQIQNPSQSQPQFTKTGRPKKPKRSLPHRKGCPGPPSGPRAPHQRRKPVVRDVICDECGNPYSRQYIYDHKIQFHNPNFSNGKCVTCGEAFTNARLWYKHYIQHHVVKGSENDPRRRLGADPTATGLVCEVCGAGFAHRMGLHKHRYYAHGDGAKKENYIKCPICPEEKMYKSLFTYQNHLRKQHPDGTEETMKECFRCEKSFRLEESLSEHVKYEHPESYWPCRWCKACRFSKYGLHFHMRKCTRGGRTEKIPEGENLLEFDLGCEFCGRMMKMTSLTRHYKEVHGVMELETFKCVEEKCRGKGGLGGHGGFKRRDYWVVHLEEKHGKKWEELREWVGKCNVASREGLVVDNGKRKRTLEGGRRRVRVRVKREKIEGEDEEDGRQDKVKRKRRNIVVIAEEDEQ